jgi:hypothetical protein
MDWPLDADGDVFRQLKADGFDFGREHTIDFNIDFAEWPPAADAISLLRREYPSATIYDPENDDPGYVLVQVFTFVNYEAVVEVQRHLSELMIPFGGRCESWGVMN